MHIKHRDMPMQVKQAPVVVVVVDFFKIKPGTTGFVLCDSIRSQYTRRGITSYPIALFYFNFTHSGKYPWILTLLWHWWCGWLANM